MNPDTLTLATRAILADHVGISTDDVDLTSFDPLELRRARDMARIVLAVLDVVSQPQPAPPDPATAATAPPTHWQHVNLAPVPYRNGLWRVTAHPTYDPADPRDEQGQALGVAANLMDAATIARQHGWLVVGEWHARHAPTESWYSAPVQPTR